MENVNYKRPNQEWHPKLAENMGSLDPKIQYLIVRIEVFKINPENQNLYTNDFFDQIVNLNGKKMQEETQLRFTNFNKDESLEDQMRHELIHHIGWVIAQKIFGKKIRNFSTAVETVVGGIDCAISQDPTILFSEDKIANLYYFIFQNAVSNVINKIITVDFIDQINYLTSFCIQKYNLAEDIIIDYTNIFQSFPKLLKITKKMIVK